MKLFHLINKLKLQNFCFKRVSIILIQLKITQKEKMKKILVRFQKKLTNQEKITLYLLKFGCNLIPHLIPKQVLTENMQKKAFMDLLKDYNQNTLISFMHTVMITILQLNKFVVHSMKLLRKVLHFYWGTSNWDADKIFQAFQICQKYNLHRPVAAQNQYNMINRKQIQCQYRSLLERYHYGLVAYSPFLGGYLTGKYVLDKNAEGRLGSQKIGSSTKQQNQFRWCHELNKQKTDQKLIQLICDLTSLAIAWVLKFPYTSSTLITLIGARNIQQVEACMKALEVYRNLNKDIESRINKILQTHPYPRYNQRQLKCCPHFRSLAQ